MRYSSHCSRSSPFSAFWPRGHGDELTEWGLGGRRFGTIITWFLLGGDLYTAYTFVAVPAAMFAQGAMGFFAVPYTILVYPVLFAAFPRLWSVCVATMPYIAQQLVGMEVGRAGLGVHLAARDRVRGAGRLHLCQRIARARDHRVGVAFAAIAIGALVPAACRCDRAARLCVSLSQIGR